MISEPLVHYELEIDAIEDHTQTSIPANTPESPQRQEKSAPLHSLKHKQADTPVFAVDRRVRERTTGLANQDHSEYEQHTTTLSS